MKKYEVVNKQIIKYKALLFINLRNFVSTRLTLISFLLSIQYMTKLYRKGQIIRDCPITPLVKVFGEAVIFSALQVKPNEI